ncbi:MAG: hypothetical protein VW169_10045 [Rhodospirillaceae bacterium]
MVRPHTEAIRPPRALWCPFELGRPLGAPDEPEFQTRVLRAVLSLLERADDPILEDFDEEPPSGDMSDEDMEGWTCPVNFGEGEQAVDADTDLASALAQEIAQLQSWYDLAVEKNGKTTLGISGAPLDTLSDYLLSFADDPDTPHFRDDLPRFQILKLAIDEHKAFYFEAGAAKPGNPTDTDLANWFYGDSVMGKLLLKINATCMASDDEVLRHMSDRRIIPVQQRHLKGMKVEVPSPTG